MEHREVERRHRAPQQGSRRGCRFGWLAAGVALLIGLGLCLLGGLFLLDALGGTDDPSWAAATVGTQGATLRAEGLEVHFEPGALPAGAEVRARVLVETDAVRLARQESDEESLWWIPLGPVYDVELPEGLALEAGVRVTVPYDPEFLGDRDPAALIGGSWNGAWWERRPAEVDTEAQTVTFVVDHFSAVAALWEEPVMQPVEAGGSGAPKPRGATWSHHTTADGRFDIRYQRSGSHAVLRDGEEYQTVKHEVAIDGDVPLYIRDLGLYLSEAWDLIAARGYTMPPQGETITVRVQNLNQPSLLQRLGIVAERRVDGATGARGPIYIDSRLPEEDGPRTPELVWQRLRATAAHELYHVVQRYNPSFPTWFYEASAVYLEWALFADDFPGMVAMEYVNPRNRFLSGGLVSGTISDHYAKGAFLIYLQEQYGGACPGAGQDIVVGGVHPFGGTSFGMIVAGLKSADMSRALLGAAQRCGEFEGSWEDLLAEFAQRYYVEWDVWPTAPRLLLDAEQRRVVVKENAAMSQRPAATWSFEPHAWPPHSSTLWRIGASLDMPLSTLVLKLERPGSENAARYWLYGFAGQTRVGSPTGPTRLTASQPTVAVHSVGPAAEGGLVQSIYIVGAYGGAVDALPLPVSRLQAYWLPSPASARARLQPGGDVEVGWETATAWVPTSVDGLTYRIYASDDPAAPLKQEVATREARRSPSVRFTPPAGAAIVTVVLADAHGNQSPGTVAVIEAAPTGGTSSEDLVPPGTYRGSIRWDPELARSLGQEVPEPEDFTVTITRQGQAYFADGNPISLTPDGDIIWQVDQSDGAYMRFQGTYETSLFGQSHTLVGVWSIYATNEQGNSFRTSYRGSFSVARR